MTVEEIDLHQLTAEDLAKYLPLEGCKEKGFAGAKALSEAMIGKKVKASECKAISPELADAIDGVLSLNLRLPESDPMMNKVEDKLIEINSPDGSSPVLITGNSIITKQILTSIFGVTKVKAYLVPTETLGYTVGYTVDNAVTENAFTAMSVMKGIGDSRISSMSNERKLIIPGVAEAAKSSIERITKWPTEIGPVSGFELPIFLAARK
jgi:CO dehydrogenase/acetyl-CoA synthase gamma subunit (corrinoid Fe-S protein)